MVSTLYYARAAWLAAELCKFINDYETEHYTALYDNIRQAFRNKFLAADGKIMSDTQSAYVMAYSFGLISLEEVRSHLVRKFEEDDGKLTTGFLGIRFLLPTLCDIGRSDIAYRLITSTEYPGWGYSVVNGATTIWERWDSYTEENGIKKGMNSFNHYSFGSCTQWMYEYCLGFRPSIDGAGLKKVIFAPCFDLSGGITSAEGYYQADQGKITIQWQKKGNEFEYLVSVPKQIQCTFVFDAMQVVSQDKDNGSYRFSLKPWDVLG